MAKIRIRHPGRQPGDRDLGPARGRLVGGSELMSTLGAATLPSRLMPTQMATGEMSGSGAVERRQATDAQRAAWAAERAEKPVERTLGRFTARPADVAASRARGAERGGFVKGVPKARPPVTPAREPDPVTPPAVTPASPVPRRIPMAAPVAPGAALTAAPLPCPTCSHEPVCRIRPELVDVDVATRPSYELQAGVRIIATSVRVECDYFAPAAVRRAESVTAAPAPDDAAPTPIAAVRPAAARRTSNPKGPDLERVARIRAAVERHGGDGSPMARSKAAKELGIRGNVLANILKADDARQARLDDEASA